MHRVYKSFQLLQGSEDDPNKEELNQLQLQLLVHVVFYLFQLRMKTLLPVRGFVKAPKVSMFAGLTVCDVYVPPANE
jgi:hypothetical protein